MLPGVGSKTGVSVVIPVHNGAPFIRAAIQSALIQSVKILECIVVDDGSQDGTADVVRSFGVPVRLHCQPQQGVARARNQGIALARGAYVAFLDADDVWLFDKIERQMDALQETSSDAVICGILTTDEHLQVTGEQRGKVGADLAGLLRFQYSGGGGSTLLASRVVLERVGGYHPELSTSADWEILVQLFLEGTVAVAEEPLVLYRKHRQNMHQNVAVMEHDMLLAFDRVFADPRLDPTLHADESQIRAILHKVLAGSYYEAGQTSAAIRHAARAAFLAPLSLLQFLRRIPLGTVPKGYNPT